MNTDDFRATPRWANVGHDLPPTDIERAVLDRVLHALRNVRFGTVQVVLQDGRAVFIETTEKVRL